MFLQVSVILSTGGRVSASPLGADTPPEHTPWRTPPDQTHPLGADIPLPWEQTPQSRHPPEADTPQEQTPPQADTPPEQTPPEQTPPRADTPWEQTPPRPDTPPEADPPDQTAPWNTVNEWPVCILLECILANSAVNALEAMKWACFSLGVRCNRTR